MTVVEISTSTSLERNRAITDSFSSGVSRPWSKPHAAGARHREPDGESQRSVEDQRQRRHHQRTDQCDVELTNLDPVDQVAAQAAEARVCRDSRGRDDLQGRGAEAAEDEWHRVGCLDSQQDPALGHAHRARGVDDRTVHVRDAGVGSCQQRRDA